MARYVAEIHGLGYSRLLVQVFQITPQVRVVQDAPEVALEVAVIDGVEAHQGREEGPIRLGNALPAEVASFGENSFPAVESVKELGNGLVVGVLRSDEARLVDAVVDGLVEFLQRPVHLLAQVFGAEIHLRLRAGHRVKLVVEHADDVA